MQKSNSVRIRCGSTRSALVTCDFLVSRIRRIISIRSRSPPVFFGCASNIGHSYIYETTLCLCYRQLHFAPWVPTRFRVAVTIRDSSKPGVQNRRISVWRRISRLLPVRGAWILAGRLDGVLCHRRPAGYFPFRTCCSHVDLLLFVCEFLAENM